MQVALLSPGGKATWYRHAAGEFRKLWSLLGATPILCCYVASLPVCSAESTWRDTLWFMFPVLVGGFLWGLFLKARTTKTFAFLKSLRVSDTWRLGASAFGAAVHTTCAAFLFLLFCQRDPREAVPASAWRPSDDKQLPPARSRTKTNCLILSDMETYSEHVYTLALLAAFR